MSERYGGSDMIEPIEPQPVGPDLGPWYAPVIVAAAILAFIVLLAAALVVVLS